MNRRFKLSNVRRSLWKNQRETMESFRQKATIVAKQRKDEKNENLKNHVMTLPNTMHTEDLVSRLSLLNYGSKDRKYNVQSLMKRLQRKCMIKFDHNKCVWINLTNG